MVAVGQLLARAGFRLDRRLGEPGHRRRQLSDLHLRRLSLRDDGGARVGDGGQGTRRREGAGEGLRPGCI